MLPYTRDLVKISIDNDCMMMLRNLQHLFDCFCDTIDSLYQHLTKHLNLLSENSCNYYKKHLIIRNFMILQSIKNLIFSQFFSFCQINDSFDGLLYSEKLFFSLRQFKWKKLPRLKAHTKPHMFNFVNNFFFHYFPLRKKFQSKNNTKILELIIEENGKTKQRTNDSR